MIRAVADDPEAAQLVGRRLPARLRHRRGDRVRDGGRWPGSRSGCTRRSTRPAGPSRLLFAFEAVVIGGLGSLWGTLVGGIVLGVAQADRRADRPEPARSWPATWCSWPCWPFRPRASPGGARRERGHAEPPRRAGRPFGSPGRRGPLRWTAVARAGRRRACSPTFALRRRTRAPPTSLVQAVHPAHDGEHVEPAGRLRGAGVGRAAGVHRARRVHRAVPGLHGVSPFVAMPVAAIGCGRARAARSRWLVSRLRGGLLRDRHLGASPTTVRLIVEPVPALGGGTGAALPGFAGHRTRPCSLPTPTGPALAVTVIALAAMYLLLRGRLGPGAHGRPRRRGRRAQLGRGRAWAKRLVYLVAAAGCGAAGGAAGHQPAQRPAGAVFSVQWSARDDLRRPSSAGSARSRGRSSAAIVYFVLQQTLAAHGAWYLMILVGLVAIVVAIWSPRGLWGLVCRAHEPAAVPGRRLGSGLIVISAATRRSGTGSATVWGSVWASASRSATSWGSA